MNKYRMLLSNTIWISIGTLGSKLIVFFMVSFYTNHLSPGDYGTADLIVQTATLLIPVISFGMGNGVFRFTTEQPIKRRRVFSTGIYIVTAGIFLFVFIVPVMMQAESFQKYIWLIVAYTAAACYHTLCAQFVRACGKARLYALQGILNTILMLIISIIFIAVLDMEVVGYVLSVVLADVVCTFFLIAKEKLWLQFIPKFQIKMAKQMLKYSVPLIPTMVFWWIISVSDRYMVTYFMGSEANGIYAVAYKIPTMISFIAGVFIEAWQYSAIKEAKGGHREHASFYSNIWHYFFSITFILCSVIIAFSKKEIEFLTTESYYVAWMFIPVLSMATVFSSFNSFLGSVYMVTGKSILSFGTAMTGAAVNVLLNLILIPSPLGIQGAAIATLASYLVVFIIRFFNVIKYIPFKPRKLAVGINIITISIQVIFIVEGYPMWKLVQTLGIVFLTVFNHKPIYQGIVGILKLKSQR